MKKILIYYYYSASEGVTNFGDILAPFLIERLSGRKVEYCGIHKTRSECFEQIKNKLKKSYRLSFSGVKALIRSYFCQDVLYSVGSILGWGDSNSYYWGSGFGHIDGKFRGGKVYATRGPKSQKRLQELAIEFDEVFGDPALLLPYVDRA